MPRLALSMPEMPSNRLSSHTPAQPWMLKRTYEGPDPDPDPNPRPNPHRHWRAEKLAAEQQARDFDAQRRRAVEEKAATAEMAAEAEAAARRQAEEAAAAERDVGEALARTVTLTATAHVTASGGRGQG